MLLHSLPAALAPASAEPGADVDARPAARPQVVAAAVFGLMFMLGGLACLAATAFPLGTDHHPQFIWTLGLVEIAVGLALVLSRRHISAAGLHAFIVVRMIFATMLMAQAAAAAGVALVGITFISVAIFSAYFFPATTARVYAALSLVGLAVGAFSSGNTGTTLVWLILTLAVAVGGEVFSRLVAQLRRLASSDQLTGVANRSGFLVAAQRAIASAGRTQLPLTLVLLDLDDFKAVNDSAGHLAGDALLVELAHAWQRNLRAADVLARYGGDEFAVLLPATSVEGATTVIERLHAAHPTRWSAGLAEWTPDADLDTMLARADAELYRAKENRQQIAS